MRIRVAVERFADFVSRAAGSNTHLALALGIVIGWAASGPHFNYSDTWQLFINTGTTIATYLISILLANAGLRRDKRDDKRDEYMLHLIEGVHELLVSYRQGGSVEGPRMVKEEESGEHV